MIGASGASLASTYVLFFFHRTRHSQSHLGRKAAVPGVESDAMLPQSLSVAPKSLVDALAAAGVELLFSACTNPGHKRLLRALLGKCNVNFCAVYCAVGILKTLKLCCGQVAMQVKREIATT